MLFIDVKICECLKVIAFKGIIMRFCVWPVIHQPSLFWFCLGCLCISLRTNNPWKREKSIRHENTKTQLVLTFTSVLVSGTKSEIFDTISVKEGCFINPNVVSLAFRINLLIFWMERFSTSSTFQASTGCIINMYRHSFLNELWFLGTLRQINKCWTDLFSINAWKQMINQLKWTDFFFFSLVSLELSVFTYAVCPKVGENVNVKLNR